MTPRPSYHIPSYCICTIYCNRIFVVSVGVQKYVRYEIIVCILVHAIYLTVCLYTYSPSLIYVHYSLLCLHLRQQGNRVSMHLCISSFFDALPFPSLFKETVAWDFLGFFHHSTPYQAQILRLKPIVIECGKLFKYFQKYKLIQTVQAQNSLGLEWHFGPFIKTKSYLLSIPLNNVCSHNLQILSIESGLIFKFTLSLK